MADEFVEDPVALRRQLAGLAEKYPERIAEVRAEIAEVDRHRAGNLSSALRVHAAVWLRDRETPG